MKRVERVFITGCGGMLGNAVFPCFSKLYNNVVATDKVKSESWLGKLDVRDHDHLAQRFEDFKPEVVLHLAAETDLEFCEKNPKIAEDTNSLATEVIAKLCEQYSAKLIYISTAGVFDGRKKGFYTEEDQPQPLSVYGQTKYAGELHAFNHCRRSFVVRAGWMMGGGKTKEHKFISLILKQIEEGKKRIFAVDDKLGTPTYTYDFAKNLAALVETEEYGLYHMVCEGDGSRFDVAKEILRICQRQDIELTPVSSEFFSVKYFAPRPPSEMMLNVNLRKIGLHKMRPWEVCLDHYLKNFFPDYVGLPIKSV